MSVNGFTFWRTYWDVAQDYTPAQQGQLYRAIAEYMFADHDIEDELKGPIRSAYKALKPNIITSYKRSLAGREKGKQDGNNIEAKAKQSKSKSEAKVKQGQVKGQVKDKDKDQNESTMSGIPDDARQALERIGWLKKAVRHAE